jgi:Acetyltransferases
MKQAAVKTDKSSPFITMDCSNARSILRMQYIELATLADFPEIIEVWEASVRATHDFLSENDIQYFKPLILNEYLEAVELFCVRENNKIVAFLGLSPDKVEMLFVHPNVFGRGIGKKLMRYAIHEKGIRKVDVNEQNPQVVGYYKHLGFEVMSRNPLDSRGKPFPILAMELKDLTTRDDIS